MQINTLLHVGYPKTATKWLQNELFPKVKDAIFVDHNFVKSTIIKPNTLFFQNNVFDNLKNEGKRIIISEENLLGSIQDGGMQLLHTKEMALRLQNLFPEANVIIFIRNQVSLIASAYLQYIKMGGNYSVQKYLFDKSYSFTSNRKLFSFDFFRFDEVIRFYQQTFGTEKVHVHLYEEFEENPELFTKQFVIRHELNVDLQSIDYKKVSVR